MRNTSFRPRTIVRPQQLSLLLVILGTVLFQLNSVSAGDWIKRDLSSSLPVIAANSLINSNSTTVHRVFSSNPEPFVTYRSLLASSPAMDQSPDRPKWNEGVPYKCEPDISPEHSEILPNACCEPDEIFTFKEDLHSFLPTIWDDFQDTVTWKNTAVLGVALGGVLIVRNNWDDQVRRYTAKHPNRWGGASETIGRFGEVQYQIPVILGIYAYSLHQQDEELHDFSRSLISAFTITGLSTLVVKGIANTSRPTDTWDDGQYGFPSYHTSSSFAIAAVLDTYYGPRAGIPALAFAGLIGWSRIDERDHDLSDVLFGAALGYVIGKSVSGKHRLGNSDVQLMPYIHPVDGTTGVMIEIPY